MGQLASGVGQHRCGEVIPAAMGARACPAPFRHPGRGGRRDHDQYQMGCPQRRPREADPVAGPLGYATIDTLQVELTGCDVLMQRFPPICAPSVIRVRVTGEANTLASGRRICASLNEYLGLGVGYRRLRHTERQLVAEAHVRGDDHGGVRRPSGWPRGIRRGTRAYATRGDARLRTGSWVSWCQSADRNWTGWRRMVRRFSGAVLRASLR